ncbi:hypothetical protein BZQ24_07845 [Salmonella enterica subsp. enterica serovar Enteritidis]|nr:hypothetical protein [Salmonella enterica subsp. enterica serovar Enteritidis]
MSQYKLITVPMDVKDLREITLAANAVQQDSELTAYERYQLFLSISDTVARMQQKYQVQLTVIDKGAVIPPHPSWRVLRSKLTTIESWLTSK